MNYPIMLNLEGKSCVIVGGGKVSSRKVVHLLDTGAEITVISPELTQTLKQWHRAGRLIWIQQAYSFEALSNCLPVLVFAATDSAEINEQIARDSAAIGAWCNRVDARGQSDFHNMAVVENPPVTLAISTNGASPALVKIIKAKLEQFLGTEYSTLANWFKDLRDNPALKTQTERQNLYESIVQTGILDLLQAGQERLARERFDSLVEEAAS